MQVEKDKKIRIIWWNVCNFYHYRAEEVTKGEASRWPRSPKEYEEKSRRVDNALIEAKEILGNFDIVILCEITQIAATELRDRIFPGYKLISLDVKKDHPTLQIAILYMPHDGEIVISEDFPITADDTARNTRAMAVLDIALGKKIIKIISCHWPSRMDEEGSEDQRYEIATYVSKFCYDFVKKNSENNHVMIIGDLNEEPHERSLRRLKAHRHRARALGKPHWTDADVRRLHLYNTSWRMMGEKHAHPSLENATGLDHAAGTFYWNEERTWLNFDQLIVSGGLLDEGAPFLNEHETLIVSLPAFLTEGLPLKFKGGAGNYSGLSDHLPIFTVINI